MKKKKNIFTILLPLVLGGIVGFLSNTKSYSVVNKPLLSPPAIVFPIAWTILYLLMGYTYELSSKSIKIKVLYYAQLIVNLIWPILFFNIKLYNLAIVWLILLIILNLLLTITYFKDNKKEAVLNIPYMVWLSFALYLNIGVSILN